MPSAGNRLGRYEVVSPLGAEGMGEVYRARDTELEREVALKVIAGGGALRLWPLPEGPPLHTRPHEELVAKLRSLTNLRVVEAPASPSGYDIEPGPFPGWAHVPEW